MFLICDVSIQLIITHEQKAGGQQAAPSDLLEKEI